ncbi:MAG: LytTR family DNA-binding domain-containing protein [Bacteroidota bacterium]
MKVAIIEDEPLAVEKLEKFLLRHDPDIEIMARLTKVQDAVKWLGQHQQELDLIFMDIQLIDGISFDIFNQVEIKRPVIFITAFDEYAIDAFKVNSIDYILKPISYLDVSHALAKVASLKEQLHPSTDMASVIQKISQKKTKDRFLVKRGNHIQSIKAEEIACFVAEGRTVTLITREKRKFIIDYKLEELEDLLSSQQFFRVNRSFILAINSIEDVVLFSNSRLKVRLEVETEKDIIVSREKVSVFKEWFAGM